MTANFLHGVETIEQDTSANIITSVKTAVIGLVGTAPIQDVAKEYQTVNKCTIISNEKDAALYFGSAKPGYTIPQALNAIFKQGSGLVIVVNVFDPEKHKDGENPDVSKVTTADVIGKVDENGERTGAQAFKDCMALFGYSPKILIAPGYSTQVSVVTELDAICTKIRAKALVDAPIGTKFQEVISGRGTEGSINFNTSSSNILLCYPHLKVYNIETDENELQPYSQFLAGVMAYKDNKKGYWYSPSNTEIKGIVGLEFNLTASINDPECEVNLLNEKGIITVFNSYGTGFLTWGNRTAAYPTITKPKNFINVSRTSDVIYESIELAMLPNLDENLSWGYLDAVCESVNEFLRTLIGRGAIVDGKCWVDPAENPAAQLALGNAVFTYEFMPSVPAERITFKAVMNQNLLKNMFNSAA